MSEPPPRASIAGIWCFAPRKALVRLIVERLAPGGERDLAAAACISPTMPALLKAMSSPPKRSTASATSALGQGLVADVSGDRERLRRRICAISATSRIEFVLAAGGDDHTGAFAGEQPGGCPPYSRTRPGHDGGLVSQHGHGLSLSIAGGSCPGGLDRNFGAAADTRFLLPGRWGGGRRDCPGRPLGLTLLA